MKPWLPDPEPGYAFRCLARVTLNEPNSYIFQPAKPDSVEFYFERYRILRETPKGFYVHSDRGETFVLNGSGKRLCHRDPKDAWHSFTRRFAFRSAYAERELRRCNAIKEALK